MSGWRGVLSPAKDALRREVVDRCGQCGGSGWLLSDKECDCVGRYRQRLRRRLAHVPASYEEVELNKMNPILRRYLEETRSWKACVDANNWLGIKKSGLHLHGP